MPNQFVFCHSSPGDLVTTRPLLFSLSKTGKTTCIVKNNLIPLLRNIKLEFPYTSPPNCHSNNPEEWNNYLISFKPNTGDSIIDLTGTPEISPWLAQLKCKTIGIRFNKSEVLPYQIERSWNLSKNDKSNVCLRYLRIIDQFKNQKTWPIDVFSKSMYNFKENKNDHLNNKLIALCPGSGLDGFKKRMPILFWQRLARFVRSSKFKIIWFLGPDELYQRRYLLNKKDFVECGDWSQVIQSHQKCSFSFSNDTCHIHIRAFLGLKSCAFFRREDYYAWGSYPKSLVIGINPPITKNMSKTLDLSINYFRNHFLDSSSYFRDSSFD